MMRENQTDPTIPSANSTAVITITVTPVNDVPVMFVSRFGQSLITSDPTEPVRVGVDVVSRPRHVRQPVWSVTHNIQSHGAG